MGVAPGNDRRNGEHHGNQEGQAIANGRDFPGEGFRDHDGNPGDHRGDGGPGRA